MIPYESEGVIKTQGNIVCPHCNLEIETQKPKIILQKPKLLIVEGKDDECFFCALIDYLKIEDIQSAGGGKNQIRGQLQAIVKDDDFNKVTSLGAIRDANNNPDDAFKSVINALKAAGLTAPKRPFIAIDGSPKVAVMIIPSHKEMEHWKIYVLTLLPIIPLLIASMNTLYVSKTGSILQRKFRRRRSTSFYHPVKIQHCPWEFRLRKGFGLLTIKLSRM